jgi:pimeloyl-ACP methyl ester carboxylesterase
MGLAFLYYHDTWYSAQFEGGMKNVVELKEWKPFCERDARNRDYLLNWDPAQFRDRMVQWARSFIPQDDTPMPDLTPDELRAIKVPVMVYHSGEWDPHHTRRASEWVAELIPNSRLVEPPWGDREWIERTSEAAQSGDDTGLFKSWPKMAPQILEFVNG